MNVDETNSHEMSLGEGTHDMNQQIFSRVNLQLLTLDSRVANENQKFREYTL